MLYGAWSAGTVNFFLNYLQKLVSRQCFCLDRISADSVYIWFYNTQSELQDLPFRDKKSFLFFVITIFYRSNANIKQKQTDLLTYTHKLKHSLHEVATKEVDC